MKITLLISEEKDLTTDYVIDWFINKGTKYKVLRNKFNIIDNFTINSNQIVLRIDGVSLSNIDRVWHRRGKFNYRFSTIYDKLNNYLKIDETVLLNVIENTLKNKLEYIGSYKKEVENNKLKVLFSAKKVNLKIPKFLITSSKKELQKFYKRNTSIITKDLHHPVWFDINNIQYSSVGTVLVTEEMLDKCHDYFIPMFLQKRIEKKYEIRVFHYKDKLYPMAIFSQNDSKTAIDYRNYNDEKPNRNIPILMPKSIEDKIFKLVNDLDLNTCSIDFIINKKNEYIFLEVNPMGQLDWVSKNCNYYIEKYIAEDLMA